MRELADMELDTAVKVEGYVVGVAHEGKSNDSEMLIKDISDDSIIAVRSVKYGTFPNYGYKKGDRIVFEATVKKDTSTSTSYNLKKYLSFSNKNGTYAVAFADFDGSKLNNIKTVPKSVEMTNRGKNVVDIPKGIELGAGDMIMLLNITGGGLKPMCQPLIIN